jgi:hypothetical protein
VFHHYRGVRCRCRRRGRVQTYLVDYAIGALAGKMTPGYLKERQKAKKTRRVVIVLQLERSL